jgi:hypothetical protein
VAADAPHVLHDLSADVCFADDEDVLSEDIEKHLLLQCEQIRRAVAFQPYTVHYESCVLCADVTLAKAPDIAPGEEIELSLEIYTRRTYGDIISALSFRWWLPEGFTADGKQTATIPNRNFHDDGIARATLTLRAGDKVSAYNRCVLEIVAEARPDPLYIPITLLG